MNKILILLVGLLLAFACTKPESIDKNNLTYHDFKAHLTAEMTYNHIVDTFGEPHEDIGSGIHIYVYELTDSTEIRIGYVDKILYAKHLNQNEQVLNILIE